MISSIPFPPPDGYHWQPAESKGWRAEPDRLCVRRVGQRTCRKPSVLAINRGQQTKRGRGDAWWGYCIEHAYGHWLEDGKVWGWQLVKDDIEVPS